MEQTTTTEAKRRKKKPSFFPIKNLCLENNPKSYTTFKTHVIFTTKPRENKNSSNMIVPTGKKYAVWN